MTDHLPECLLPDFDKREWVCICKQLRACEQRVREDYSTWHPTVVHHCCVDVQKEYARGLDAAEAAVAEQKLVPLAKQGRFIVTRNTKLWDQRQVWSELGWWDFRKSALAAIDALREGKQ